MSACRVEDQERGQAHAREARVLRMAATIFPYSRLVSRNWL